MCYVYNINLNNQRVFNTFSDFSLLPNFCLQESADCDKITTKLQTVKTDGFGCQRDREGCLCQKTILLTGLQLQTL